MKMATSIILTMRNKQPQAIKAPKRGKMGKEHNFLSLQQQHKLQSFFFSIIPSGGNCMFFSHKHISNFIRLKLTIDKYLSHVVNVFSPPLGLSISAFELISSSYHITIACVMFSFDCYTLCILFFFVCRNGNKNIMFT